MQPQPIHHNRQKDMPTHVLTSNGLLLNHLLHNLLPLDGHEPSICAKLSMRSSIAPKPGANGGCCQKTFRIGGMYGITTIYGPKTAPGSVSMMHYASRCVAHKGVMKNHHSVSLIVNRSKPRKRVA